MLELIIALLMSLGVISSADQASDQVIQDQQELIQTHIIDDDLNNL